LAFKVIEFGANREPVYDFLLLRHKRLQVFKFQQGFSAPDFASLDEDFPPKCFPTARNFGGGGAIVLPCMTPLVDWTDSLKTKPVECKCDA